MSSLVSITTGNFTSSSTWALVDTTSELDSNASSVIISTSNIDTATFTPGAIDVYAIAVKILDRAASPSGTFSITLRNSTDATDVVTITVNVSDLPYHANVGNTTLGQGWFVFKLGSVATLTAGKDYILRAVCSAGGNQVTLWRNGTSNNFCRKILVNTTQAPASGDHLVMAGYFTAAATGTSVTVTLNNTATTSFGPTVSGGPPEGIVVGQGATFDCTNAASTAYYLKWKGIFHVTGGGTVQFGTSGTPLDATSTLTLYADCASHLDSGIVVDSGGTFNGQGATKVAATTLTVDASNGATTLTVGSTSGWLASDVLGLGPGSTTISAYQTVTIASVDSGTGVTVSSISEAKRGSAPHLTEVINITRNIKLTGASSSLRGFLSYREVCAGTLRYAEFDHWGSAFTTQGKMGIDLQMMGSGSATLEYCSWNQGNNSQPNIMVHTSKTGSFYTEGCVAYKPGSRHFYSNGSSLANCNCENTVIIGAVDGSSALEFNLMGTNWKFNGTVISGAPNNNGYGIQMQLANQTASYDLTGKFDDCRLTYQGISGFFIGGNGANSFSGTIDNMDCHLNTYMGVRTYGGTDIIRLRFSNCLFWGHNNTYGGFWITSNAHTYMEFEFLFCTFAGSSIQGQVRGILNDCRFARVRLIGCDFGQAVGTFTTHSTADYDMTATFGYHELTTSHTKFGSTNKVQTFGSTCQFKVLHNNYNGTSGDHRADYRVSAMDSWTIRRDATIYNTAAPSERITPSITSTPGKAFSSPKQFPIDSGATKTVTAYVRKSSSGDGATYNGAQPRLICRANPSVGLLVDTVIMTMSSGTGSWQALTGTSPSVTDDGVLEFFVDLTGTVGWVNVDDWNWA